MSNDVILDATVKFIMEDVEHLNLAFRVEEAMPHVRETLVREVLDDIKEHFSGGEWKIFPWANKEQLTLREQSWPESIEHDLTGIELGSDRSGWGKVYVGLHISDNVLKKIEKEQNLSKKLNELKTYKDLEWPLHWKYLCGELEDWRGEKFLERALQSTEKIVSEVTDQLKAWQNRKEVRGILSVAKCSYGQ